MYIDFVVVMLMMMMPKTVVMTNIFSTSSNAKASATRVQPRGRQECTVVIMKAVMVIMTSTFRAVSLRKRLQETTDHHNNKKLETLTIFNKIFLETSSRGITV